MSGEEDRAPGRHDDAPFSDADELRAPSDPETEAQYVALLRSLVQSEVSGVAPSAVLRALGAIAGKERERALFALCEAMQDAALVAWIEADAARKKRAIDLALRIAPPDPSPEHNNPVVERLKRFRDWGEYAHSLIVVPGYTPLDKKTLEPGVHPVCRRRLEQAMKDVEDKRAFFVLVSGANVYPRGTPYYEAIEMKKELLAMGLSKDRIIVEARARHSTTNLRNAGRFMRRFGLRRALVTTVGGGVFGSDLFDQDFYFSNPVLSTFYARCERELGYRVGELEGAGARHTTFIPSPAVERINYRDPLDP